MGGGSSKSSQQTTQNTTNVQDIDTTSVGLEDVALGAVAGGDLQVTQISTDQGAVEAGRKLGEASLDFAGEFGDTALRQSFQFGSDALGTVQKGLSDALDFGADVTSGALSFAQAQTRETQGNIQTGFNALGNAITAAGQATRSDTAATLQSLGKYGFIALAVLGLGLVFVMYRRR